MMFVLHLITYWMGVYIKIESNDLQDTVASYLNLRPYLDGLFEASKCTQRSHSLAGNSLKFGKLPTTAAPILENAFCIFPQLWNVHQCTRQNLKITRSSCGENHSFG